MNDIATPQAIFFDWDGTLVDSYPLIIAAHNYARDKLSLSAFGAEEFRPYFGKPRDLIYSTLYTGQEDIARQYFEEFVLEHHSEQLNPMGGAKELLDDLKSHSFKMAVISNKKAELLNAEIKALNWAHYFGCILGSGDTQKDKPDPEPLNTAAQALGTHAEVENIWYIGDSEVDMESAHRAYLTPVLLGETPLSAKYQPKLIFKNCEELHAFVLQCLEKPLNRSV